MKLLRRLLPSLLLVACGTAGPGKGPAPVPAGAVAPHAASEVEAAVPIAADDAVQGSRLAPVTLVVFSDFQCPYCARFDRTIEELRAAYGPEELRIVFKNDPLDGHEHARLAAEIGQGVLELAGAEAFFRFAHTAFAKQRELSPEALRSWAIAAGADGKALEDGLGKGRWTPKVARDVAAAARLEVDGTPCAFVNGIRIGGARPFAEVKVVVEAERARAKELLASGAPADLVYTKLALANQAAEDVPAPALKPKGKGKDRDDEDERDTAVYRVPVAGAPARGPADALVTIVEFSDFQCPFCKRVEPTLAKVRETYGDKVRIVWRDEPLTFHARAEPAAELARSARAQKGEAGFWAAHDALLAADALEDADLERIAGQLGLDAKKTMQDVAKSRFKAGIEADVTLAKDLEARGTPHFFFNGRRLGGAQPFEKMKALVETEIARAEAKIAAGTPRKDVYDALVKDGVAPGPTQKTIAAPTSPAPFRGPANAKVVIQAVGDFQCPYCKRGDATMKELLERYPGKIKVVWRDLPLAMHKDAPLAAEAAREAFAQKGNAGFLKMSDLLFENQGALGRADLDGYAKSAGLDPVRFAKALDEHVHRAEVEADHAAANAAGVSGTPAFFVGPYYVSGAQPLDVFTRLVDLVLAAPAQK